MTQALAQVAFQGSKRSREDDRQKHVNPEKRQRLQETEQWFRFLDLPGGLFYTPFSLARITSMAYLRMLIPSSELRNRVYEAAIAITAQKLPPTVTDRTRIVKPRFFFPFLGLTQTCSKIRTEFQGWWMEAHTVNLGDVNLYLATFLPNPSKYVKDKKRLGSFSNRPGKITIMVRHNDLDLSLLRLLKLRARIPGFKIVIKEVSNIPYARGLDQLVNNKNPDWLRMLRSRAITEVIGLPRVHIVTKERHAEEWMKVALFPSNRSEQRDKFKANLGLDKVEHWEFTFGVNYS
ncbi:uncharacterized protein BDR25DRAFT_88083 [Lindgomyces ingoldianus]|uniref:Uncharacterized protein n=1 Tax=Lindgomyces ingoldianus TaxID=673940 RepID=A0ACB6RAC5_9PLEO|nr:uncharacterized protein BDR25DRAFT_88083 [Lindgomyces ingoldianus]KAF2475718.1 hypothetical protein BDR25DRAFT_88083 [Lindgomyces ingoldianus]